MSMIGLMLGWCCLPGVLTLWPQAQTIRAGAARVEITPDVRTAKVPLGGYAARKGEPASGVHDSVWARALVLQQGEKKVGIVALDLCFLPANIKTEVVRRLQGAGRNGLDAEHLFLAASHTHTAPDPLAMHAGNTYRRKGWTSFDGGLLEFVVSAIVEAIRKADSRLEPARIGSGSVSAGEMNRNRRGDKILDSDLTVLKVTRPDGSVLASVVNFAAHPTLYSDRMMEISADWPGVLCAALEKRQGPESVALFLNGAEGDASPHGAEGADAHEKVAHYGQKIAAIAARLSDSLPAEATGKLDAWTRQVALPPRKPTALFLIAATSLGLSMEEGRKFVDSLMPEQTRIGYVRVGDLLLMGLPCEPTGALGIEVKAAARKAGCRVPALVALANDWLGYALSPAQYRAGGYETSMSFYGETLGPTLLAELEKGLRAPGTPGRH